MSEIQQTTCYNPATGEMLGRYPLNTAEDVAEAVKRAREAQPAWAAKPVKERARAMLRVRDYLVSHADQLAETISRDNGKTRVDALATEILMATLAVTYYARQAKRFLKDRRLSAANLLTVNKASKIVRVPFGVIGIISPWNYPFAIPFSEVIMGLLAGNAVILKTASETQMVGRAMEQCFMSADLPEGIFTYLNLPGRLASEAFLTEGIDKLFFTGSVAVGKTLMAKAAETLTPVSLELGGNDAMLVCPDAELHRAAGGAVWAGLQNCGQSCGGVERIYVHEAVYEQFIDLLAEKVQALRIGCDTEHNVDLGAMTTSRQMETVQRHVDEAVASGAVIYAQADAPQDSKGNFMQALVLTEVDHAMLVMREETFGPVLGVMKVENMDQAVELANDSNLGLTGSVWSRDSKAAEKIARQIEAGVVTINDHLMSHGLPQAPWGGFKESGIGRTHGAIGFDEMTEPQCIVHDFMPGVRKNLWWYPHNRSVYNGLKGIIEAMYSKELVRRFSGALSLIRIFPRIFRV